MDYTGIRVKVRELMMANGVAGLFKFSLITLLAILCISIVSGVVSAVINIPVGIISNVFDDNAIAMVLTIVGSLATTAVSFVFISIFAVGLANMYKNFVLTGVLKLQDLFIVLQNGSLATVVKTMLLMFIQIFWRTLLCFVPGILYSFKVILVPFILTENPDMTSKDILALSTEMMNGCKMDLFVCQLMCIPFVLLGSLLSCCTLSLSYEAAYMYLISVQAAFYAIRVQDYNGNE